MSVLLVLGAGCFGDDGDEIVAFRDVDGSDAPPVEEGSDIAGLEASLEDLPESVAAGGTLTFTAVLTNDSPDDVRLDPCPAHDATFGESGTAFNDGPWLLNCEDAEEVPADGERRFEVQLDVTE